MAKRSMTCFQKNPTICLKIKKREGVHLTPSLLYSIAFDMVFRNVAGTVKSFAQISFSHDKMRSASYRIYHIGCVLKILHVHVFLLAPMCSGNMAEPGANKHSAELLSGKVPPTRVRRRISRFRCSIALLVRIRVQCSNGKSI